MIARYALPLLGFASLALAQAYTCDGLNRPNWDHCDELMAELDWTSMEEFVRNDDDGDCYAMCKTFNYGNRNCLFSVCFDSGSCDQVAHSTLKAAYDEVLVEHCKSADSGGSFTLIEDITFTVSNDPGYSGSQLTPETFAFSNKTLESGVNENDLTPEDMEKVMEAAASVSEIEKRQDDEFILVSAQTNRIRDDVRIQASPILSSGAEYTWSFSETITVSTTMSADVGVSLFEIFTASVGIETTKEHSETVEEGLSFTVGDCPDEGVVYFHPLFDRYEGYWTSNTDNWVVWIPVGSGEYVDGRFVTECLG